MNKSTFVYGGITAALMSLSSSFLTGNIPDFRFIGAWMPDSVSLEIVSYILMPVCSFLFGGIAYSCAWQFSPGAFAIMMCAFFGSLLLSSTLANYHDAAVIGAAWLSSSLAGAFAFKTACCFIDDNDEQST